MSHRIIRGLKWAMPCSTPQFAFNSRTRGVKHRGIKYERELWKALGSEWTHGQWFKYEDSAGAGFCQVDFLRQTTDAIAVLEAKLTWVPEAHTQLELLYRPVVEFCYRKPMIGLVVCRRLVPECRGAIAQTLPSALTAARSCRSVVLHWSTKAPLQPCPPKPQRAAVPLSTASPAA